MSGILVGLVLWAGLDPVQTTCTAPPSDVYTSELGATISAQIPALKKYMGETGISAKRKAERIRESLPGVHDFRLLEYTFCDMYRHGRITKSQYVEFVQKVLPIIPRANVGATSRTTAAPSKGPSAAAHRAELMRRDSVQAETQRRLDQNTAILNQITNNALEVVYGRDRDRLADIGTPPAHVLERFNDDIRAGEMKLLLEAASVHQVLLVNRCHVQINVALRYRSVMGVWVTRGWWQVAAGDSLAPNIASIGPVIGFYAEGGGKTWDRSDNPVVQREVHRTTNAVFADTAGRWPAVAPKSVYFFMQPAGSPPSSIRQSFSCT